VFEHVSGKKLQRAMQPNVSYGRHFLADTLRQAQVTYHADTFIILTQPEPWAIVQKQFTNIDPKRVIYLNSMEQNELFSMERALPQADIVMGIGGGQAMDAAKYVAFHRNNHLILAPTIVSVDAGVTNTIAVREGQRVRYIGFVVADAIPVDFKRISLC
jgi:glycerol dehydrogenase-like iron-containing ADH family enzyme